MRRHENAVQLLRPAGRRQGGLVKMVLCDYITGDSTLATGKERYRRERGWSGRTYLVRMSAEEIKAREHAKLWAAVLIGMPAMVWIMAIAAGLI